MAMAITCSSTRFSAMAHMSIMRSNVVVVLAADS
ncbi:hypothetical protein PR003_g9986 [Phytophthora rubi]|uniref:Uncharacterized protein n=1 Tax=Phytophthora rubi TaxID=129364 RepID=A0A6A3M2K8_9STRA|nr:hypothetical protein PR002_g11934 [Phytophthora rubi]KAE9341424.1 hypothetical protein PR003_g9986 [Phytophthora rubi]